MIISGEQARLAACIIEPPVQAARGNRSDISPELMERILSAIAATPDMRTDRVIEAVDRMEHGAPKPSEIAEMIVARAICDALR